MKIALNPVLKVKTYEVWSDSRTVIGEVNASSAAEAFKFAREQFSSEARVVILKKDTPCLA